jgi:hypothetical protein
MHGTILIISEAGGYQNCGLKMARFDGNEAFCRIKVR